MNAEELRSNKSFDVGFVPEDKTSKFRFLFIVKVLEAGRS